MTKVVFGGTFLVFAVIALLAIFLANTNGASCAIQMARGAVLSAECSSPPTPWPTPYWRATAPPPEETIFERRPEGR